jgi:hypothetical protein
VRLAAGGGLLKAIGRLESPAKRVLAYIGAFLLATLLVCIPIGVFGSSNIVWGEPDQYGRVDFPGTGVVHLPAGSVDAALALDIPGKGNQSVDLPVPSDVSLSIAPVSGSATPMITRDLGQSNNASDDFANTVRRVWTIEAPEEGDYTVTGRGRVRSIGINAQLWFGHGPPIPGTLVPLIAAVIVLLGALVWFVVNRVRSDG